MVWLDLTNAEDACLVWGWWSAESGRGDKAHALVRVTSRQNAAAGDRLLQSAVTDINPGIPVEGRERVCEICFWVVLPRAGGLNGIQGEH